MKKLLDMKIDAWRICDKYEYCTCGQLQMLDDGITVHARMEYLPFSFK